MGERGNIIELPRSERNLCEGGRQMLQYFQECLSKSELCLSLVAER